MNNTLQKEPNIPNGFEDLTENFLKSYTLNIDEMIINKKTNVLIVRGLFGNLLKGNLLSLLNYLKSHGFKARYADIIHSQTIDINAKMIANQIKLIDGPIIILAHSKGGLDALYSLRNPDQWHKVIAVGIAQTSNSPSFVLKSFFNYHKYENSKKLSFYLKFRLRFAGFILHILGLDKGAKLLASEDLLEFTEIIKNTNFSFPVFAVSSWSKRPTSIVDSYHRLLNKLNEGIPHDGQFYLYQQQWSKFKNILINEVDHAEIALPVGKFDEKLFWLNYLKFIQNQSRFYRRKSQT